MEVAAAEESLVTRVRSVIDKIAASVIMCDSLMLAGVSYLADAVEHRICGRATAEQPLLNTKKSTPLVAADRIAQRGQHFRHCNEAAHLHSCPALQLQLSSRSIEALPCACCSAMCFNAEAGRGHGGGSSHR